MRQASFASGFERFSRTTKRAKFLAEMDQIVPWRDVCKLVLPHYPAGARGRPPVGVERMLRIYLMQQWFNLSDPAAEEALYDSAAMRAFVGIDLGREAAPDETTICKFRHLLEAHDIGVALLAAINTHLKNHGVTIGRGTIVDATIIHAPPSTKNAAWARDPEMHQTKKGNQWYFGMKAHVGMDSRTRIIHAVVATAANTHDSQVIGSLLHGAETKVWGDSAYQGQRKVIRAAAPDAQDMTNRRGSRNHALSDAEKARNTTKARVRSRVEHAFRVKRGNRIDIHGYDAGKKINGKKRHILVDTIGLLLHAVVHPADIQDRDGGILVLSSLFGMFPFLLKLFADGGYQGPQFKAGVARVLPNVSIEIVKRSDHAKGFEIIPKRWVVERTLAWLNRCRRLAKDFENLTRMATAFIQAASIRLMVRRLCNL